MDEDIGVCRIKIDGNWGLGAMGETFRAYVQLYAAVYFLAESTVDIYRPGEGVRGRYSYEWRGGYSAQNFFRSLAVRMPRRHRPEVLEITYASPGYIDLVVAVTTAMLIFRCAASGALHLISVYKEIQREIRRLRLNRMDEQERAAHTEFMVKAYGQLTHGLDLPKKATERLDAATNGDHWANLKIALALAKRLSAIAELGHHHRLTVEEPIPLPQLADDILTESKRRKVNELREAPLVLAPAAGESPEATDDESFGDDDDEGFGLED